MGVSVSRNDSSSGFRMGRGPRLYSSHSLPVACPGAPMRVLPWMRFSSLWSQKVTCFFSWVGLELGDWAHLPLGTIECSPLAGVLVHLLWHPWDCLLEWVWLWSTSGYLVIPWLPPGLTFQSSVLVGGWLPVPTNEPPLPWGGLVTGVTIPLPCPLRGFSWMIRCGGSSGCCSCPPHLCHRCSSKEVMILGPLLWATWWGPGNLFSWYTSL